MTKHYVVFLFPGIIYSECETHEISERKPELINLPEGAFAYCFFDRTEDVVDGETFVGNNKNYSPMTYLGTAYTLEEVKAQFPEHTTLIFDMEYNGWNRVVKTRCGKWQPLKEGDIVV